MNPLFSVNRTINQKNEDSNGTELIAGSISEKTLNLYQIALNNYRNSLKVKLPLWIDIIRYCLYFCIFIIAILFLTKPSFFTITTEVTIYYIVLTLVFVAGLIIIDNYRIRYRKKHPETPESKEALQKIIALNKVITAEQGCNENFTQADVLSFYYVEESSQIKIFDHKNLEIRVYVEDDTLYLCDLMHRYALPLNSFQKIHKIEEKLFLNRWNKEDIPFTDKKYTDSGIIIDKAGVPYIETYYVFEFITDSKTWGLYVPCYELEFFENLICTHAES